MKMGEVSIGTEETFSHELPRGTRVFGVPNPLVQEIVVGLPEGADIPTEEYRFMTCKTGEVFPDDATFLGSIGCGTTHVFFLDHRR